MDFAEFWETLTNNLTFLRQTCGGNLIVSLKEWILHKKNVYPTSLFGSKSNDLIKFNEKIIDQGWVAVKNDNSCYI